MVVVLRLGTLPNRLAGLMAERLLVNPLEAGEEVCTPPDLADVDTCPPVEVCPPPLVIAVTGVSGAFATFIVELSATATMMTPSHLIIRLDIKLTYFAFTVPLASG
jgi:hypothetical protein